MDPYHVSLGGKLKDWADRYGYIMGNKGGAISDGYEYFIVTSQYSIEECFTKKDKQGNISYDDETISALRRRFIRIRFNDDGSMDKTDRDVVTCAVEDERMLAIIDSI